MVNMTEEELRAFGRAEKKEFMKRWGYWPCNLFEFNESTLHCIKIKFKHMSTKDIVAFLKQEFSGDFEIMDIENNYVHFHYFMFLDSTCENVYFDIDLVLAWAFEKVDVVRYEEHLLG